ncbi:putative ATPase/DNA-binding winged helix-turn-helix (wHTH) protein [Rhizobium tibeticum]|uniref:ATP-binding protein n=1 Tax=Rhizobium tibeticum TaxID=501024 RepID=UPI00278495A2|nr:winged helix-turn-helix domain-containing protein [Rhizobium tibeticum]MDP9810031.1 putative ATPase/DNA-binding winged helix-turn-helix (wHTH) protein [Rhizobium tibeticum]
MEQIGEPRVTFGLFILDFERRTLFEAGRPVRLGSRALDLLCVLVTRAGELVTKDELIASVWPDTYVDEGNLRVHIAALRKVLGEDASGTGYVTTVPGRGYRFIAIVRSLQADAEQLSAPVAYERQPVAEAVQAFSVSPMRIFGRGEAVSLIAAQLPQRRFISLVGIGGIGKTTVALAAAGQLSRRYPEGIQVLDLGALSDPSLLLATLATGIGRPSLCDQPLAALTEFLKDRRMLIVLDGCEHMIGAATAFAEALFTNCASLHLVATSREPLRAQGERVMRLGPLEYPDQARPISAEEALEFPAIELFVERAAAYGDGFHLTDAVAPLVAEICRTLDGIALAIELAAGRVGAFGVAGLAEQLDDRFRILTNGRRTALPRQQTLQATFEWSYDALPEAEKTVFRRLGVFSGLFPLDAAREVVVPDGTVTEGCPRASFMEGLANLVEKSLVIADISVGDARYRLLDTTRAFALEKLRESGDLDTRQRLHAENFLRLLQDRPNSLEGLSHYIDNVRSALIWSFSGSGDAWLAVLLAAAAAPLFVNLSLLGECARWTAAAVDVLPQIEIDKEWELVLWTHHAISLIFLKGNHPDAGAALSRALALADDKSDFTEYFRLHEILFLYHLRIGKFAEAQAISAKVRREAEGRIAPPLDVEWMFALSAYFHGDHRTACAEAGNALLKLPRQRDSRSLRIGTSPRILTMIALARSLWWLGSLDQAVRVADACIEEARELDHPVTTCTALAYLAPISLWRGDLETAECRIDELLGLAARQALYPSTLVGTALKGALLVKRGRPDEGYALLKTSLDKLRSTSYRSQDSALSCHLVEALASLGLVEQALELVDRMLADSLADDDRVHLSVIHCLKGELLTAGGNKLNLAEEHFRKSIEIARQQHAVILELAATTALGRVQVRRGEISTAIQNGRTALAKISEGLETDPVVAARQLIDEWDKL